MSVELRQVANGFAYRVKIFVGYDVNGYRFHTTSYDQSQPNQKPHVLQFLRPTMTRSSIMEELKKYMNSIFLFPNLLLQLYSYVFGLTLM
jgi:hypothetical protein